MTEQRPTPDAGPLQLTFTDVSGQPPAAVPEDTRPAPFSLRLSRSERAALEAQAGHQPLGAFIRARLLGDTAVTRTRSRRPAVDHQKLALVLAELGRSRLASNMNQIAKAANLGALAATPSLVDDLEQACRDVRAMRDMLIAALGLKVEG